MIKTAVWARRYGHVPFSFPLTPQSVTDDGSAIVGHDLAALRSEPVPVREASKEPSAAVVAAPGSVLVQLFYTKKIMSNIMQDPDERTQLLVNAKKDKPEATGQLILLTLIRAAHPICFAVIFPYIAPLLVHNGIATDKNVGLFAGTVESAYSASLLVGLAPAIVISDAYGRKKAILFGLVGASIATAYFGLARTFVGLVLTRAVIGFCVAFIPATIMVMLLELSTRRTEALNFSLAGIGWSFGSMIAPVIGGLFSSLSDMPTFLQSYLHAFPYALPGFVVGLYGLSLSTIGFFVLHETLLPKNRRSVFAQLSFRKSQTVTAAPLLGVFTRSTSFMLSLRFLAIAQSFLVMSSEVLFFYSPRNIGGLALSNRESASVWTLRALLAVLWGLPIFPRLVNRYGCERVLRVASFGVPFISLSNFTLAYATYNGLPHKWVLVWVWSASVIQMPVQSIYAAVSQLLTMRAPSRLYLTRISTASEVAANLAHGLGAFLGSVAFKTSVERGLLQGRAAWILYACVGLSFTIMANMVTVQPTWRDKEDEQEEVE